MGIGERLAVGVAFPLAERVRRRAVLAKLGRLRELEREPLSLRRDRQRRALAAAVAEAGASVPYYRDLFRARRFDPQRVARDPAWLAELPLLDREIVVAQGTRLLSERFAPSALEKRRTGGSTGRALDVWYDAESLDWTAAVSLWVRSRMGCPPGRRHAHLPFALSEPLSPRARLERAVRCAAHNRRYFFLDTLDEPVLAGLRAWLDKERPDLVYTFPSAMRALAEHVARHGGGGRPLFRIFESTGEVVEPETRAAIEATLGCRVVDRYGNAELGVIACERPGAGAPGLEILDPVAWVETVADADGDPELVVTSLRNPAMPLLRYRTGDLGRIEHDERSVAGRITGIVGRRHAPVRVGGRVFPTTFFQEVFRRLGCVEEFQIQLRSDAPPLLRLVVHEPGRARVADALARSVGNGVEIAWVGFGDLLRRGRLAKFSHVVSEGADSAATA